MFQTLCRRVIDFLKREDGPTSVEYAVNLALIIGFLVSTVFGTSNKVQQTFSTAGNAAKTTTGS